MNYIIFRTPSCKRNCNVNIVSKSISTCSLWNFCNLVVTDQWRFGPWWHQPRPAEAIQSGSKWRFTPLGLCMLGNFSCFCVDCWLFFKINYFQKFFQEHYRSVKQFQPRSGPTPVGPDLGRNCLQRFFSRDKSCHQQGKSYKHFNVISGVLWISLEKQKENSQVLTCFYILYLWSALLISNSKDF